MANPPAGYLSGSSLSGLLVHFNFDTGQQIARVFFSPAGHLTVELNLRQRFLTLSRPLCPENISLLTACINRTTQDALHHASFHTSERDHKAEKSQVFTRQRKKACSGIRTEGL